MAATQSAVVHCRDASFESPQPSVVLRPSSPTLTNPDMILPDYDDAEPYGSSPVSVWELTRYVGSDPSASSVSQSFYHAMPLGPSTPIIYGNGTMLSDIGEVTEVESLADSPPRCRPPRHSAAANAGGTPLRSSPTVGKMLFKSSSAYTVAHARGQSFGSDASCAHETDRVAAAAVAMADMDDPKSLDDSNFQGDDKQSMASSYIEDMPPRGSEAEAQVLAQVLHGNRLSSSSLSKRAEQILANAKRRLNTMEGNLSRARNFGYSSASEGSTLSPDPRPTVSLDEASLFAPSSHLRHASETGLPASLRRNGSAPRSASVGGPVGSFRQPLTQSKSADALITPCVPAMKLSYHPLDVSLKSLSEGDHGLGHDRARPVHDAPGGSRASSVASPSPSCYSDASTSLSNSAAQVRELQNQMEGLKGKISSLREQARADSLKRRSLQGRRTQSPLTHATWDQRHLEPLNIAIPDLRSPAPESPWSGTVVAEERAGRPAASEKEHAKCAPESDGPLHDGSYHEAEESQLAGSPSEHEAIETPRACGKSLSCSPNEAVDEYGDPADGQDEPDDDVQDAHEVADADYWSKSGESMYHDAYQHPVSHEDREDAFDYERFFLHSAMGTISRQGRSRSSSSSSGTSEDSVETTRGPSLSRARRPSLDTFTTVESFATAYDDGRASRSSLSRGARREGGLATPSPEQVKDDGEGADHASFEANADSGIGGIGSSGDETSPGRRSRSRQNYTAGSGHDSGEETSRWQRRRPRRSSAMGSVSSSGEETSPWQLSRLRQSSVVHRPCGSTTSGRAVHRPSCSSFESTGTNRSFPLVNKVRMSRGMLTPGSSPEQDLKQVSESLMSETASMCDKDSLNGTTQAPAIQMLSKADRIMVERVVASLGRCVLGLTEASRTDAASEEFRRRIDEARKMLEAAQ